jgi:hypothetical protein
MKRHHVTGVGPRTAALGGVLMLASTVGAHGGLYWQAGVRAKTVTVCFVGDALTSRPARVQQILSYIKHYEYAANVRFSSLGTCPAAGTQANGDDFYDGDIRFVIPNISVDATQPVPGKGCPATGDNSGWGSWSNSPNDLASHRSCLYNLKLGDDPGNATPYLNHTLHEVGHALGLAHEHERKDVDHTICNAPNFGGNATSYLTTYDRYSVMHYKFATCGINGNYDYTGLSDRDRLAVHILYPEDVQVAEFVGTTVVTTNANVVLGSAWKQRGAVLDLVANDFSWKILGSVVAASPDLNAHLSAGDYTIQYAYMDFLGRSYSYSGRVHVLEPEAFARRISGPIAARAVLY